MTTDTIREAFDEWEANIDDDEIADRFKTSSFVSFDDFIMFEAYKQGQRDLIEEMGKPVAHMFPSTLKKFEFGEHVDEAFSIEVGSADTGERSVPLYRLPEGAGK